MQEKYLPIGTVVMLEGGTKRLMITGFCAITPEKQNEIYDYVGCLYPEGLISSKQTALFNHNQIKQIYALGYSDEEEKGFKEKLNQAMQVKEEKVEDQANIDIPKIEEIN